METIHRRHFLALSALGLAGPAAAFPLGDKPIRLLVGFPAGGGTDAQARLIGQHLSPLLGGVPVVIENRPGAGTMIAANEVVRSAPDGHTLIYTPATTIAQLPHTLSAVKYDPFRDFTPVAQCALGPLVLVLHKSIPANNLDELVAYARQHPGQLNYVSTGVGSSAHVLGQMLGRQAGIDIVHVPYKGAADVSKDFIAGRVHLQFASSSAAASLARSGQVRLLAVIAPKRSELFPDIKTMGELGIAGMDLDTSLGVIGPAKMPPATVARLSEALRTVMDNEKVREEFRKGGVEPQWTSPETFSATIRKAHADWGKLLATVGYQKL